MLMICVAMCLKIEGYLYHETRKLIYCNVFFVLLIKNHNYLRKKLMEMKQEIYIIGYWNYIKTTTKKPYPIRWGQLYGSHKPIQLGLNYIKITLNKLSGKIGSPPANKRDPPVFKSIARIELLSLSAM